MPLPLAPIATVALRYGVRYGLVALSGYAMARSIHTNPRDQRAEDALDDLPEGLTAGKHGEQANGSARMKRTFRAGPGGPGVEVDLSAIGRFRVKRVRRGDP